MGSSAGDVQHKTIILGGVSIREKEHEEKPGILSRDTTRGIRSEGNHGRRQQADPGDP
jgi:hypothetical protein